MEQGLPLLREPTVDPGAFSVKSASHLPCISCFVDSSIVILSRIFIAVFLIL
jgi:hypothetical protein